MTKSGNSLELLGRMKNPVLLASYLSKGTSRLSQGIRHYPGKEVSNRTEFGRPPVALSLIHFVFLWVPPWQGSLCPSRTMSVITAETQEMSVANQVLAPEVSSLKPLLLCLLARGSHMGNPDANEGCRGRGLHI